MLKKISKFLLCTNPMVDEVHYIFCTRDPEMIMEVKDKDGEINFEILEIYSGTSEEALKAMKRAKDWYIAYKLFLKNK